MLLSSFHFLVAAGLLHSIKRLDAFPKEEGEVRKGDEQYVQKGLNIETIDLNHEGGRTGRKVRNSRTTEEEIRFGKLFPSSTR